jgi:hypothetical protein
VKFVYKSIQSNRNKATGTKDAVDQIIIEILNKGSPLADLSIFANQM